jgi:hypothetical protein
VDHEGNEALAVIGMNCPYPTGMNAESWSLKKIRKISIPQRHFMKEPDINKREDCETNFEKPDSTLLH